MAHQVEPHRRLQPIVRSNAKHLEPAFKRRWSVSLIPANGMGEARRTVASFPRAVAELLAEGAAEVGCRVEPDRFRDIDDAAGIPRIAQGCMSCKQPAPLDIMIDPSA